MGDTGLHFYELFIKLPLVEAEGSPLHFQLKVIWAPSVSYIVEELVSFMRTGHHPRTYYSYCATIGR